MSINKFMVSKNADEKTFLKHTYTNSQAKKAPRPSPTFSPNSSLRCDDMAYSSIYRKEAFFLGNWLFP